MQHRRRRLHQSQQTSSQRRILRIMNRTRRRNHARNTRQHPAARSRHDGNSRTITHNRLASRYTRQTRNRRNPTRSDSTNPRSSNTGTHTVSLSASQIDDLKILASNSRSGTPLNQRRYRLRNSSSRMRRMSSRILIRRSQPSSQSLQRRKSHSIQRRQQIIPRIKILNRRPKMRRPNRSSHRRIRRSTSSGLVSRVTDNRNNRRRTRRSSNSKHHSRPRMNINRRQSSSHTRRNSSRRLTLSISISSAKTLTRRAHRHARSRQRNRRR